MQRELLRKFEPFDVITVTYSVVSGIILLFASLKLENIQTHLLIRVAVIAFIVFTGFVLHDKTSRFFVILRQFYFIPILLFFLGEGNYIKNIILPDLDKYMANFELTIFSQHPGVFLASVLKYKWVAELMSIIYLSYFIIFISFLITMYRRNRKSFSQIVFIFCITYYMLLIIYMLCPVAGPQYALVPPENHIPDGYFFRDITNFLIIKLDLPASAFPSACALILCFMGIVMLRNIKGLFKFFVPLAVLILISTLYLKLHYAIDVIAGLLAFPAFYWISTRTYDFINNFLDGNVKSLSSLFYSIPKIYGKHS